MKAQIRFTKTHCTVLCELGHLIDYHLLDETWGGSSFEADVSFHSEGDRFERLAENCQGYGHAEGEN